VRHPDRRQRARESEGVVLQVIGVPRVVTPWPPSGEQKAPGWTTLDDAGGLPCEPVVVDGGEDVVGDVGAGAAVGVPAAVCRQSRAICC
jgi:hypothetical protein